MGCARQLHVVRQLKTRFPDFVLVGTGYTYFQEYLGHVAQATVRAGWTDIVGIGRMVLSYPELPGDLLAGKPQQVKHLCRTFSDCTTAPRNGLISGCYPLDDYYKKRPERVEQTVERVPLEDVSSYGIVAVDESDFITKYASTNEQEDFAENHRAALELREKYEGDLFTLSSDQLDAVLKDSGYGEPIRRRRSRPSPRTSR